MSIDDRGYLRIGNEADRITVASILFKNGYSVFPTRYKRNGKTYEYYVKYIKNKRDMSDEEVNGNG